uniref:Zinc finger protein 14-like n=1 Tax=Mastacembelus armatus TaxID=205130 RepID=A0A7N8XI02_9TELE
MYYSDNDEDRSAVETNPARTRNKVEDYDEDFAVSSTNLKGPYCPICINRCFRDANKLARHMRTHTKEKPFTCPVCTVTFNGAKSQDGGSKKQKVPSKTKIKGHFCPICVGRGFRGPNKLARHMRTHTKEKPFTCPICALTFSQSYHMTRHLRNQHSLGQYLCSKCGKSLSTWLELKAHKKTHADEGLTCLACDKQFKEKSALANHLKLHKKVDSNPRSLVCGDCGKVFGRMYHLKRHIVTHRKATNSECYTCPDCQRNFAFPEDLNKHLQIHVKENNGTCPKCNETFNSPEELESHMGKPFQCSQCSKSFRSSSGLRLHSRQHMEVRPTYKCPECGRTYGRMTELKMHQRYHTGDKPYMCTCCNKQYSLKITNEVVFDQYLCHTWIIFLLGRGMI